jgi:hypothetical protein
MMPLHLFPIMKATTLFCAAAAFAAGTASGEVLYTFDDPGGGNPGSIAPFVADANAVSCQWSPANGGSMELSFASGWQPKVAKLDLRSDPLLSAEYDSALVNGGTLSFTIIVRSDDILGTVAPFRTAPGWFETIYIGNTSGVWDQQFGGGDGLVGLYGAAGFPASAVQTVQVSYPIVADTTPTRDRIAQFSAGSGWNEIFLGMNSGGGDAPAPGYSGGKYYIDNFKIAANTVAPPLTIPNMSIVRPGPGMHFHSAGVGQYDRQGLRTTGENFSWVGAAGPVEYKFTFKDFPNVNNMNAVMYLAPGTGVTSNSPDWSEPVCIQVAIIANGTGGGWGRVSYKDDKRDSNGVAGHEYWVADDGTGLGGQLASAGSTMMNGTWTLRFDSSTSLTFISPDGTMGQGTLLPATAAKFANPLAAWFGTVPADLANIGKDAIVGGIGITGVPNPISENFSGAAVTPDLQVSAVVPAAVYLVNRPAVWVRWTLPAPSFALEQSASLADVDWAPAAVSATYDLPGANIRQSLFMPDPPVGRMFFRLHKP